MIKHQGEHIPFTIELENLPGLITNFSEISNLIIYAKTKCHVVKFSMTAKDNYEPLFLTDNLLSGAILPKDTALMEGALFFEIMVIVPENGVEEKLVEVMNTGIDIKRSTIKNE